MKPILLDNNDTIKLQAASGIGIRLAIRYIVVVQRAKIFRYQEFEYCIEHYFLQQPIQFSFLPKTILIDYIDKIHFQVVPGIVLRSVIIYIIVVQRVKVLKY